MPSSATPVFAALPALTKDDTPHATTAPTSTSAGSSKAGSIADKEHTPSIPPLAPSTTVEEGPKSLLSALFRRRRDTTIDLDAIATKPSVFDDPDFARAYQPHPQWENAGHLDPLCRWTVREERALVRKLDWRILAMAFLMFFALDLDRENIAQANSDGLLNDLGISTADYNLGNSLFRVAFLLAELPSQIISKRIGADRWIPAQLILWSAFSMAQFSMRGRASFLAYRFIIGALCGGFIPDVVLWLSYFYTSAELPIRLTVFWLSNYLVKIVSPFLALGLLRIRGNGRPGWAYLFLLEGLLTLVVGIFAIFHMPAGPVQTKNWLYPRGWFTRREEDILVNRVARDDPSKGDMTNRQGLDWGQFKRCLKDYDLWPMYLLGFTFLVASNPVSSYLTLELRHLKFSTAATNALSIPGPVLALLMTLIPPLLAEIFDHRTFVCAIQDLWYIPCYVALYLLPISASPWVFWVVATLTLGAPYVHPIQVAWIARNSGSVRTRAVSAALYNMAVQVGTIAGVNVYQPSDAPEYRKGNLSMALLCSFAILQYVGIFFYYRWRNASKAKVWDKMSKEEQVAYLEDSKSKDLGNKSLAFRFAL